MVKDTWSLKQVTEYILDLSPKFEKIAYRHRLHGGLSFGVILSENCSANSKTVASMLTPIVRKTLKHHGWLFSKYFGEFKYKRTGQYRPNVRTTSEVWDIVQCVVADFDMDIKIDRIQDFVYRSQTGVISNKRTEKNQRHTMNRIRRTGERSILTIHPTFTKDIWMIVYSTLVEIRFNVLDYRSIQSALHLYLEITDESDHITVSEYSNDSSPFYSGSLIPQDVNKWDNVFPSSMDDHPFLQPKVKIKRSKLNQCDIESMIGAFYEKIIGHNNYFNL